MSEIFEQSNSDSNYGVNDIASPSESPAQILLSDVFSKPGKNPFERNKTGDNKAALSETADSEGDIDSAKAVTGKDIDVAREKLLENANTFGPTEKELKLNLALFEFRCAMNQIPKKEVLDSYKEVSRILDGSKEHYMNAATRQFVAFSLVEHLGNPTTVNQANFDTCLYSGVERMVYGRHPAKGAKMVADIVCDGTLHDDKVKLIKNELPHNLSKDRSASNYLAQMGMQNLCLQLAPSVRSRFNRAGDLRYSQLKTIDNGRFGESVVDYGKSPARVMDKVSSQWFLGLTRGSEDAVFAYQELTGDRDSPVAICANSTHTERLEANKIDKSAVLKAEDVEGLNQILDNVRRENQFPIMAFVHTSNEPFYSDSGEGKAGGAGGITGGWHAVILMSYNKNDQTVAVDNSWGEKADRLGLIDGKPKIHVSTLLKAMKGKRK